MVNDESTILQSKLQLAEQRMLSGEPNVPLTEARSRLQAKYDGSNRPNSLYPNGTPKTPSKPSH
ncbi:MAG: hypothetical protein ACI4I2_02835 [Oscillospiraceae bacterium]